MSKSFILSVFAICIFGLVACEPMKYEECGGGEKDEKDRNSLFLGGRRVTWYHPLITRLSMMPSFKDKKPKFFDVVPRLNSKMGDSFQAFGL